MASATTPGTTGMIGTRGRRAVLLVAAVLLGSASAGIAAPLPAASGTVFIQTVPALAGLRLAVGPQSVTTGPGGAASLRTTDLNGIASRVTLADASYGSADTVAITKVVPAAHAAPHESHLAVGLDVASQVSVQIDPGRTGVPVGEVESLRLHSNTGQRLTVDPRRTQQLRLLSRQTHLVAGTLTAQIVTWSVDSVVAGPGVSLRAKEPGFDPFGHPTWQLQLQPVRGTVTIDTVPGTAGVTFTLDGATITTDANGRGEGVIGDLNDAKDRVRLATPAAGPLTVSVLRFVKQPAGRPFHRHLLATLAVRRPISLTFTDGNGRPVPATRISEVRLQGGGQTLPLTGPQLTRPVWMVSELATQVEGVWQPRKVTYSVASVRLDGGDAVFTGQQRFDPNTSTTWPIALAVFDVTVTVRDVLFGQRISTSVWVTKPDGARYRVRVGSGSGTVLDSMVRGPYDLKAGAAVYGARTKLLVSRNDQVNLRVVTALDVVVIVFVLVLLAAALVLLGRQLRKAHARRAAVRGS